MTTQAMKPEDINVVEDVVDPQVMVHEPHGFVRLVDWTGTELAIVNAARVSFHKESQWVYEPVDSPDAYENDDEVPVRPYLSKADAGLINYLLSHKHGTPFEHGFLAQFHLRVPIFVMREWVRHRVGFSINEESGRYTEMRGDFFYPERVRTQTGKSGAYTFEDTKDKGLEAYFKSMLEYHSQRSYDFYKEFLDLGVAKEQARLFLPLNLYTEFRWTCNARSLMNFLALRNDPPAMKEIRDYAQTIEGIFKRHMPTVHEAFEANGRVAP